MIPTTRRRTQLLREDVIYKATHDRCQVHGAETQVLQEPRGPEGSVPGYLFKALVWGLLRALASQTSLFLLTPASGKKQGRAGPALWDLAHPHPQAPAELKRSSASGFRAPAVWPHPPHPTSCKSLSQQARKSDGPSWDGERKNPSSCRLIGILNS